MTEIASRIEALRAERGMSRAKMCRMAGIPPTTYSNYLHRGDDLKIETIEAIAEVLEVTPEEIRFGASASTRLDFEIKLLRDKIAALPASAQDKVIKSLHDVVSAYENIVESKDVQ